VRRSLLLVVLVALAAAAPSLRDGFVYDDVPVVQRDARVHRISPRLATLPYWSGDTEDRIYRPATTISFALDWAAGRGRPLLFHLTNLLLHAAVSALVLLLAARLLGTGAAVVAALLFAVHPVHVEAVTPVVGRAELLAALGYLAAVLGYAADGDARSQGRASAAAGLVTLAGAVIAFGAKEHALTLPAALVLSDVWEARRRGTSVTARWRSHALLWAGVLTLALGYLAARAAVVGTATGAGHIAVGLVGLTLGGRALVMMPAVLVWARLLVFPLHLSADYSPDAFPIVAAMTARHALAAALLIGVAAGAWFWRRRVPALWFAVAWCAVSAAVATNLVLPTGVTVAERVLYLPSVGFAIAVGALWERLPPGRWLWPLTSVIMTLLAARSLARASVWHDEERFMQALERDAPASYRTFWARGARAFASGDARAGEAAYRRALAIWPDPEVMEELGERFLALGAWAPADRWCTLAFGADSTRGSAAAKAVVARLRAGHADSAVAIGETALHRFPEAPLLLLVTAEAWREAGRPVRALTLERRAAYATPGEWQAQLAAASGAARIHRCDEALIRVSRARTIGGRNVQEGAIVAALAQGPCGGVR
jgi:protein O-mannosyl-transferase